MVADSLMSPASMGTSSKHFLFRYRQINAEGGSVTDLAVNRNHEEVILDDPEC